MNLRKNPVIIFSSAPDPTFVVRQKRITGDFFDDLKLVAAVPPGEDHLPRLESQSVRPCHSKVFCIEPLKCKVRGVRRQCKSANQQQLCGGAEIILSLRLFILAVCTFNLQANESISIILSSSCFLYFLSIAR